MHPFFYRPTNHGKSFLKSRKDFKRQPGFDPIIFSENSNYGWESLLEVERQNIAGRCQQTFKKKRLLTSPGNVMPYDLE